MTRKTPASKATTKKSAPRSAKDDQGAPIERYHGEVTDGKRTGDPGDLDEETLDRDAPFNKSYGLRDEDGASPLP